MRELDPAHVAVKAGDAQGRDAVCFAESSRDVEVDRGVSMQPREGPRRAQEGALELDPRARAGHRRHAGGGQPWAGEREVRRELPELDLRLRELTELRGDHAPETIVRKAQMQEEQEQQQARERDHDETKKSGKRVRFPARRGDHSTKARRTKP